MPYWKNSSQNAFFYLVVRTSDKRSKFRFGPFLPVAAVQSNATARNDQNVCYLYILKVVCLFLGAARLPLQRKTCQDQRRVVAKLGKSKR